jgi:hypothetical protein
MEFEVIKASELAVIKEAAYKNIKDTISDFDSISLDEMNEVALMKRKDTKFVTGLTHVNRILDQLKDTHRILEIDGNRIMDYTSLYFDTPNFKFYNDHHNGRFNRTKIRQRKYEVSDLTFLEIKQKNGKGETQKSRIQIDDFETELSERSLKFIEETTNKNYKLSPSLRSRFKRMTLVNLEDKERITVDILISYSFNKKEKDVHNIAIFEVKQSKFDRKSLVVQILKNFNYNPYSVSKYCIGAAKLNTKLKYNLFKKKFLRINKLR